MRHRVGRLHIGLQVQLQVIKRGERQTRDNVVVQLVDDRLDNRLIYAIEGSLDFFFGLRREAEAVPIFTVKCVVGRVVGDRAETTGE